VVVAFKELGILLLWLVEQQIHFSTFILISSYKQSSNFKYNVYHTHKLKIVAGDHR